MTFPQSLTNCKCKTLFGSVAEMKGNESRVVFFLQPVNKQGQVSTRKKRSWMFSPYSVLYALSAIIGLAVLASVVGFGVFDRNTTTTTTTPITLSTSTTMTTSTTTTTSTSTTTTTSTTMNTTKDPCQDSACTHGPTMTIETISTTDITFPATSTTDHSSKGSRKILLSVNRGNPIPPSPLPNALNKHRKNCECCPGHCLIVNHYSSMS